MVYVQVMSHYREDSEGNDIEQRKILGIYNSKKRAQCILKSYKQLPGFSGDKNNDVFTARNKLGLSFFDGGYTTVEEIMSSLYGTIITEDEKGETFDLIIDIPYWAKEQQPKDKESATDFATRIMQQKYGNVVYPKGPQGEFFQIKKLCETNNFSIPKAVNAKEPCRHSTSIEVGYSLREPDNSISFVYFLHHVNPLNDDEKPIGIYSSLAEAEAIVEKYKKFKGFKDAPEGFYIDPYELDKPYWVEGYYSVVVPRSSIVS